MHQADLLRVRDEPAVPLQNNAGESDIRCDVKVRKVSGGTRSALGRRSRGTFARVRKTCRKRGVSFWEYVKDRVSRKGRVPRLAELIRSRSRAGPVPGEAVPA